jgi:hypothetical protein
MIRDSAIGNGTRPMRAGEPEKRLMVAVLQAVMDDCRGSRYRRGPGRFAPPDRKHNRQARAYAASVDRAWPFSFENLCDALDVDARSLRLVLRQAAGATAPVG